jgi:ABC-type transport system substrate-binding protein
MVGLGLMEGVAKIPAVGQVETDGLQQSALGAAGYNPDIEMIPYGPEGAWQLLAESGFPDGFEFQFTYTVGRYPQDRELGEVVSDYLGQVGVPVNQRRWSTAHSARHERKVHSTRISGGALSARRRLQPSDLRSRLVV